LLAFTVVPDAAVAEPRIQWRVENAFRFFTDPADTEMHRASFVALSEAERKSPVLSVERALAERMPDGWAANVYGKTCWNPETNRHECKAVPDYINPRAHRIIAWTEGIESDVECNWLTRPRSGIGNGETILAPCGTPVRLDIPYPAGSEVRVEVGGINVAMTDVQVTDLLIVGMGDSFASGDGNPDLPVRFSRERSADYGSSGSDTVLAGYPARVGPWRQIGDKAFIDENARWIDQACHRSLYSHQLRAALQLAIEDPHRAVTFTGFACSGAEVTEGLFLRYKGHEWVPSPPELSQISAVAQAQCATRAPSLDLPEAYHMKGRLPELKGGLVLRKCPTEATRKIDLIFVSVGGNDIGFSRLVANAVLSDRSSLRRLGGWFGQVFGFIEAARMLEGVEERYKALNRAVHNILQVPWGEADRVILAAYPPLAILEDGKSVCPDGRAGMTVHPDFALSELKARESSTAAERLHDIMRSASRQLGWSFADSHRKAFQGRGVCAGWTDHALSTADDLRLPRLVHGQWQPFNPADWRAYAPRQRWFRTPNDAFMTGNFHVSASLFQKVVKLQTLSWFQVMLASIYSGAFHPTAEGQAAMADSVAERGRRILAKYANHRLVEAR
jgi:hypothetical protein